jgi:hypothetical protein
MVFDLRITQLELRVNCRTQPIDPARQPKHFRKQGRPSQELFAKFSNIFLTRGLPGVFCTLTTDHAPKLSPD